MTYSMPVTQRLRKLVKSLYQKQYREQNGLFVAEGEKLVEELLNSDNALELVVLRESPTQAALEILERISERPVPVYNAPKHVFDQMCDTKTPQCILALSAVKESIIMPDEPFIALDGVADPGNVGTIIRTADWFGIKQVILNKNCADKYNPKVVRSTMGSIFKIEVIETVDLYETLNTNFKKHKIYGATLDGKKSIDQVKFAKKFGLLFGNEARGLSENLLQLLNETYKIEGYGNAESLNVSVAAGISMFHFAKGLK